MDLATPLDSFFFLSHIITDYVNSLIQKVGESHTQLKEERLFAISLDRTFFHGKLMGYGSLHSDLFQGEKKSPTRISYSNRY